MSVFKQYIGDGVYIDYDGYRIILTTENGASVNNTIYIEPGVMLLLLKWLRRTENLDVILKKSLED